MKKKTIRESIFNARTEKSILQEEVAEYFNTRQSNISYIERQIDKNSFVRYLWYLRKRGVDINDILDKSILIDKNNSEK